MTFPVMNVVRKSLRTLHSRIHRVAQQHESEQDQSSANSTHLDIQWQCKLGALLEKLIN